MKTAITDYLVNTETMEWVPLIEPGIATAGIFVKPLRRDEKQGRAPSILLRFEASARYPYHNHPGGEELFVLQGSAIIEGVTLRAGDYLYTPPGFKHAVTTATGCVLLLHIPREVEILE
ncbi:MAG: cupin domain-containing protein [Cyclobacteriaceae bacterium]|jgi:quercetin dioxygenase-like cupin family protein|nr:cupin domain-containing protein [Cyclobacteriaceae bacterium]